MEAGVWGGGGDTRCKQGCIYLFGVSGWSQWNLVFGGGGGDTKCKHGCIYIYLVFQGGVRGSWCLGGCVVQGVSRNTSISGTVKVPTALGKVQN